MLFGQLAHCSIEQEIRPSPLLGDIIAVGFGLPLLCISETVQDRTKVAIDH